MNRTLTRLVLCAGLLAAGASGHAAPVLTFTFSQTGFSGGGSVTGSFTGTDSDGNGQLSSLQGEISAFSLSFAGDSIVQSFTHGLGQLYGLVYDLGSGLLGDGSALDVEGLATNFPLGTGTTYASGQALTGGPGGYVLDDTGNLSATDLAIVVNGDTTDPGSGVPAPATAALAALGLAALAAARRRRG